ncbi:MAG: hypothetical protein ACLRP3_14970 [Escherichia sp.]
MWLPGMQTTYGLAKGKGLAYEPQPKACAEEQCVFRKVSIYAEVI